MVEVRSGRYASFLGKTGDSEIYNRYLEEDGGRPWKYVEYDLFPQRKSLRIFNAFPIMCVNPRSPNKERAVMLIELLMNDNKSYDIFTCGIEGKDFVYSGGKPKAIVPSGKLLNYDGYMYNNEKWCFNNVFMKYEDGKTVRERIKNAQNNTEYYPHAGFLEDWDKIREAVNDSDLKLWERTAFEEKVIRGELSDAEIMEYIEEFKPGSEVLMKEFKRQLDEWREQNKK